MILGIGIDCVSTERIKALIDRFDARAMDRLFTKTEQEKANKATNENVRYNSYAKRFAAKEAFSKALGTGMGSLSFYEIEVKNLPSGAPEIHLSGNALKVFEEKTAGRDARVHLSLGDERTLAQAIVVIEVRDNFPEVGE